MTSAIVMNEQSSTTAGLSARELRTALSYFPTSIVLVGAVVDGEPRGLVMGSFTSLSLDPPLVSVSVQKTSTTWPALARAHRLGVSVLTDTHVSVLPQLSGGQDRRFHELDWRAHRGALVLPDAPVQLVTEIDRIVNVGDHHLVILRVDSINSAGAAEVPADSRPLVFYGSAASPHGGIVS